MADKVKFKLAAGVNSAEVWVGGEPFRLDEKKKTLTTDDPAVIEALGRFRGFEVDAKPNGEGD